jgi:hypothetical protein
VDLITPAQRDELFNSFERDAFHLELRDDYGSPIEDTPYARWQRGEPDDYAHSQYVGWEHSLTHLNLEAGENIRWLPRHQLPEEVTFPVDGNDWWLYDDRLLAVGHFDPEG